MCGIVFVVGNGQKSWVFDCSLGEVAIKKNEKQKNKFISSGDILMEGCFIFKKRMLTRRYNHEY
jgi:hypothetical protein